MHFVHVCDTLATVHPAELEYEAKVSVNVAISGNNDPRLSSSEDTFQNFAVLTQMETNRLRSLNSFSVTLVISKDSQLLSID